MLETTTHDAQVAVCNRDEKEYNTGAKDSTSRGRDDGLEDEGVAGGKVKVCLHHHGRHAI